jgi:hypothetical protein
MPEEQEVETENLRETIHEEVEREGSAFLKRIALTTAIFAAFAAVAALQAGSTANEALALKTEATRLQAEASDKWAYFQAQGIKAAINETARNTWLAANKEPPPEFAEKEKRYASERVTLEKEARALERERDDKLHEADHLLHTHHGFAYAVTLFQVSIALGAVAALTRARSIWIGSMSIGLGGIVLFVIYFFE